MLKRPSKIQETVFAAFCLWLAASATVMASPIDSTSVAKPSVSVMTGLSATTKPGWNDVSSAITYSQNAANTCTGLNASSAQGNCASKVYTTAIGAADATAPLCPVGYDPIIVFGGNADSPSGALYYTDYDFHYPIANASQQSFYQSQYYSCPAYSYYSNSGTYITSSSNPDGYFYNLSGDYPSPYIYMQANINNYPNVYTTIQGMYLYLTYYYYYFNRACYTQPRVPAPDSSCGTVAGAYWEYTYYFWYNGYFIACYRNAGWYPAPTAYTYPLATTYNTYQPTITICGKSTNSWIVKP